MYHINRLKEILGHDMCFQLLFIHSIFGSEMTYIGFSVLVRLLSRSLQKETLSFNLVNQVTVSNVIKLFVSTIYTLSYYSPIDVTSGI